MGAFRRVEPQQAGPSALGILVPPGARTLVILRPRSLDWDLLPARWDGDPHRPPSFCTFDREEAAQVARRLSQALQDAVKRGVNPVETLSDALGQSFQVWVRAADLYWIVCRRAMGQEYQPVLFADAAAARASGQAVACVVWPAANTEQQYYFNTQRFAT